MVFGLTRSRSLGPLRPSTAPPAPATQAPTLANNSPKPTHNRSLSTPTATPAAPEPKKRTLLTALLRPRAHSPLPPSASSDEPSALGPVRAQTTSPQAPPAYDSAPITSVDATLAAAQALWERERPYWLEELRREREAEKARLERAARKEERRRKRKEREEREEAERQQVLRVLKAEKEEKEYQARRAREKERAEAVAAAVAKAHAQAGAEEEQRAAAHSRETSAETAQPLPSNNQPSSNTSTMKHSQRPKGQSAVPPVPSPLALSHEWPAPSAEPSSTTPPDSPTKQAFAPPHTPTHTAQQSTPGTSRRDMPLYALPDDFDLSGAGASATRAVGGDDSDFLDLFGGAPPAPASPPYIPTSHPPDPSSALFTAPINHALYQGALSSPGYRTMPYGSFDTLDGRLISARGAKRVNLGTTEEEEELLRATGRVRGIHGFAHTILSPVASESERGSSLRLETLVERYRSQNDTYTGDVSAWRDSIVSARPPSPTRTIVSEAPHDERAVEKALEEFAKAEEAFQRARDRLAIVKGEEVPDRLSFDQPQEVPKQTRDEQVELDALNNELEKMLERAPSERQLHILSTGRTRPAIATLPALTSEEKKARKAAREAEKLRWDTSTGVDPRSTTSAQRAAVAKACEAYEKRRAEIGVEVGRLEASDALLVRMGAPKLETGKIARLYAELGRLCWSTPLVSVQEQGAMYLHESLRMVPGQADVLVDLGEHAFTSGDVDLAIEQLEKSAQPEPDNARAWLLLGQAILAKEGANPTPRSQGPLQRATTLGRDTFAGAAAWYVIGQVYEKFGTQGSYEKALDAYDSAYADLRRAMERSEEEQRMDKVRPPAVEKVLERFKAVETLLGLGQEEDGEIEAGEERPTPARRSTEPVKASARMYDDQDEEEYEYNPAELELAPAELSPTKQTVQDPSTTYHTPVATPPVTPSAPQRSSRLEQAQNLTSLIAERVEGLHALESFALVKGSASIACQHLIELSKLVRSGAEEEFDELARDLGTLAKRIAAAETLRQRRPPDAPLPEVEHDPTQETMAKLDALARALVELNL